MVNLDGIVYLSCGRDGVPGWSNQVSVLLREVVVQWRLVWLVDIFVLCSAFASLLIPHWWLLLPNPIHLKLLLKVRRELATRHSSWDDSAFSRTLRWNHIIFPIILIIVRRIPTRVVHEMRSLHRLSSLRDVAGRALPALVYHLSSEVLLDGHSHRISWIFLNRTRWWAYRGLALEEAAMLLVIRLFAALLIFLRVPEVCVSSAKLSSIITINQWKLTCNGRRLLVLFQIDGKQAWLLHVRARLLRWFFRLCHHLPQLCCLLSRSGRACSCLWW